MNRMRITGAWIAFVLLLFAAGQAQADEDRGIALLQDVDVLHRTVTLNDVKYRVGSFTALEDENGTRVALEELPARVAAASRDGRRGEELAVWYELGERRGSGVRTLLRMRLTEDGMPR